MVINGEKIMGYMLSFSVINQELVRTDDLYLVNKIQNYVYIEFSFDGKEWEDIDKYVIFTTKLTVVTITVLAILLIFNQH